MQIECNNLTRRKILIFPIDSARSFLSRVSRFMFQTINYDYEKEREKKIDIYTETEICFLQIKFRISSVAVHTRTNTHEKDDCFF